MAYKLPGGHSVLVPPDPIPNSEVKRLSADDSVRSPHVKVGHCQASTPSPCRALLGRGFFIVLWYATALVIQSDVLASDRYLIKVNGTQFFVTLAQTHEDQVRGLMHRTSMPDEEGLLMIFEQDGRYPIWMKNTHIPLDVLWLDVSGKIVDAAKLSPCVAYPCPVHIPSEPARYVLEVNQGRIPKGAQTVEGLPLAPPPAGRPEGFSSVR